MDDFDADAFSQALLDNEDEVPVEVSAALAALILEVEEHLVDTGKRYRYLLADMIERGSFESFKLMYPLVKLNSEEESHDIWLMLHCAIYGRPEILAFMLSHDFEPQRFIDHLLYFTEHSAVAASCVDVVPLVAAHSAQIHERQVEICTKMLPLLFVNISCVVEDEMFEGLAKRLLELGAKVSSQAADDIMEEFPNNAELHQLLLEAQQ
jgi:hypothetical protein